MVFSLVSFRQAHCVEVGMESQHSCDPRSACSLGGREVGRAGWLALPGERSVIEYSLVQMSAFHAQDQNKGVWEQTLH